MSIPPQIIRVKRKQDDVSPVTFLQFDENAKRHRTGSNWVYQRRHIVPQSPADTSARVYRDSQPIIHISSPDDDASKSKKHDMGQAAQAEGNIPNAPATKQHDADAPVEPRRFHISRKMMMPVGGNVPGTGVSKKTRYGPAVFVERNRAKATKRASRSAVPFRPQPHIPVEKHDQTTEMVIDSPAEKPRLKRPTAKSRSRSPAPGGRTPLPASAMNPHNQDMSKVAADMNSWVMREIGANLESMELEKQKSERARFKPKAPAKRFQERHPGAGTPQPSETDTAMSDISDLEDDDDWVIDEYVRIPAHAMIVNVAPTDVGLLVLDGKDDNTLFFGPDRDDDDDDDLDDEDENAENHYTADYPEDEVASDDEYGRQPYGYRNGNASDDEEFDNTQFEESDDGMLVEGDDEDATMARIKAYMKRSRAFQ
ncbi:hypothetical protein B0J13DRAFT_517854 [Dactylonectria estremocensis]|uniref:Transcription factor Iwr1 domain-containing protein n=1 Tax=Dactylonectria estremocensis TaxID=1079267 RepID=A0A9P9FH16_9HYPO|nr:hypothetical protein B0J13DRAFT_517854 [Dactylonectria estremocensis]